MYSKNISQGIINSTITKNSEKSIQSQYKSNLLTLQSDYLSKLNSIQLKKDVVEKERANALANFDISYANKLNK